MNGSPTRLIAIMNGSGQLFAIDAPARAEPEPPKPPETLSAVQPEPVQQLPAIKAGVSKTPAFQPTNGLDEVSNILGRLVDVVRGLSHDEASRARSLIYA